MTNLARKPPLGLKAPKPERGTAAAKAHLSSVKALPCVCCGAPGPSDAHHVFSGRYGSRKTSDYEVIPLCRWCHQDGPQSIHRAKATWEAAHGMDYEYLPVVADMLAGQLTKWSKT